MLAVRTIGILLIALVAGCAGVEAGAPTSVLARSPSVDPSAARQNRDGAGVADPAPAVAKEEATVVLQPSPGGTEQPAIAGDQAAAINPVVDAPPPFSRSQSAAKVAPLPAKASAKIAPSPVAIEQPQKKVESPAVARKVEPTLDMAALKARLRDTHAIGVFTKLALKNQVDDLLKRFREHYLSGQKTGVGALRQPYDMLVLKVLALIQDGDPSLARTIAGSREAIWSILADPEKFNSAS